MKKLGLCLIALTVLGLTALASGDQIGDILNQADQWIISDTARIRTSEGINLGSSRTFKEMSFSKS